MTVELLAFTCGSFQAPLSFFLGGNDNKFLTSPIPAYLIRHATKGMALFDTGLGYRFRQEMDVHLPADKMGFTFRGSDELSARLRAAGIDPADIRWVINSHLHCDHCGGNASFPNATIVVQRKEKEAAYAAEGNPVYDRRDFDTGQPYLLIDGEHDFFGDGSLILMPTWGHTPGHQSARVRLPGGDVILTADCCYLERNLDTFGIPATNYDFEASLDVLKRLKAMRADGTRLFYGHDGNQWRHVPQATPIR
jgi:glyoxylase-like metal-dependent hydrolase (beta-lactamase superfamily II)